MTKFTEDQEEEGVLEGAVVKAEPLDDDIPYMEDNYLEPTVCLTEPEEISGGLASVDPSTVTTNTPTLALATVPPDTPILGGRVTPHPTDRMIAVHPSQFIRTTCSKVFLPPGIYKYARNNGLNSIMSVRADTGSFDALEAHYLITSARGVQQRKSLAEEPVVQQPNGFQQPVDALQLFTIDLQKQLGQKESKKGDFDTVVAMKWAELSYDEKRGYYDRATAAASPIEGASAKPKKTTNIPLPALKRFAATIASGLKEKQLLLLILRKRHPTLQYYFVQLPSVLQLRQVRLLFFQSRGDSCGKPFERRQRNICCFLRFCRSSLDRAGGGRCAIVVDSLFIVRQLRPLRFNNCVKVSFFWTL